MRLLLLLAAFGVLMGVAWADPGLKHFLHSVKHKISNAVSKVVRFALTHSWKDEVCYGALGCFSLRPPWVTLLRPVPPPNTPDEIDAKFYLFTRAHPVRFDVPTFPDVVLNGSDFSAGRPTFFVVHGFDSNGNASWLCDLKDALLQRVDGNVFVVDWGRGANAGSYLRVVSNTRIVGAELARLGRSLVELGADPGRFHFLGHSLGAQIAAYAAKNITRVGRITAMDPAQPLFDNLAPAVRLDRSDASFVSVVHSNAKPFVPFLGFGMLHAVGHVDFYMNGGADQPGCKLPHFKRPKSFMDFFRSSIKALGRLVSCSHGRSYEYVTEAIRNPECRMWGHKVSLARQLLRLGSFGRLRIPATHSDCRRPGDCTPVGLDTPRYPARGTFSVRTAPTKPYCVPEASDDGSQMIVRSEVGHSHKTDRP